MGDSGVEFLVGADDDQVTEPPGPVTRERRNGLLVLLAVAVVGVALIVRGVGGRPTATRPTRPVPSPTASPTVHPTLRPAGCPGGDTCEVVRTVPASTVTAVREVFPDARLQSALSVVVSGGTRFGSPLVARRIAFTFGGTDLSIAMTQRRCVDTEAGDRVTRQYLTRFTATLLVKGVPGDVEGDTRLNDEGDGAQDAYCFLDSIEIDEPRGTALTRTTLLDRLAVDEALRTTD